METKHTKGEWEFYHGVGIQTKYQHICDITFVGDFYETVANAKLIAAAPELLEALILMSEYYIHDKSIDDGEYIEMEQKVINAIKKATI